MKVWVVFCVLAALCLTEGRVLKQDPASMVNVRGDQPAGMWAVTGHDAEAGAASAAKGVRYNEGKILVAGEGAPGPLALGIASSTQTASGNTMAEPSVNMGRVVVVATIEGARGVAGSRMADTAEDRGMHAGTAQTGTSRVFTARHVNNKGSHAFTEKGGTSTATTGQGNGPAAMAFGAEIAAFSRSHVTRAQAAAPGTALQGSGPDQEGLIRRLMSGCPVS